MKHTVKMISRYDVGGVSNSVISSLFGFGAKIAMAAMHEERARIPNLILDVEPLARLSNC